MAPVGSVDYEKWSPKSETELSVPFAEIPMLPIAEARGHGGVLINL